MIIGAPFSTINLQCRNTFSITATPAKAPTNAHSHTTRSESFSVSILSRCPRNLAARAGSRRSTRGPLGRNGFTYRSMSKLWFQVSHLGCFVREEEEEEEEDKVPAMMILGGGGCGEEEGGRGGEREGRWLYYCYYYLLSITIQARERERETIPPSFKSQMSSAEIYTSAPVTNGNQTNR